MHLKSRILNALRKHLAVPWNPGGVEFLVMGVLEKVFRADAFGCLFLFLCGLEKISLH